MVKHYELEAKELRSLIKKGELRFGGNAKLKIYGRLNCNSGKRMLRKNRVFFQNIEEALINGYRPCGNCMKEAYKKWKHEVVR